MAHESPFDVHLASTTGAYSRASAPVCRPLTGDHRRWWCNAEQACQVAPKSLAQIALCTTIASLAEWSIFPSIDRKIDQSRSLSG
jgi:hypothetical protein